MKNLTWAIAVVCFQTAVQAQIINIEKAAKNAITNRTNQSINSGINKGVNSVFEAPGKIANKVETPTQQPTPQPTQSPQNNPGSPAISKAAVASDFTAGKTIIFQEDFAKYQPADFPDQWTTNGWGEVRTVDQEEGQWLQVSSDGIYAPNTLPDLPETFTMEYDAIFSHNPGKNVHYIFYIYSMKDQVTDFKETNYPGNAGIYFAFNTAAGEVDAENFEAGKAGIIDNHQVTDLLKSALANRVHVAIARQKTKLTLYINGTKIFSSSSALPLKHTYNAIKFGSFYMGPQDFMLITNLTIGTN